VILSACTEIETPDAVEITEKPEVELYGADITMVRGAKPLFKIHAPHVARYENKELMIFDGGIRVDFYNQNGDHNAVLTSDKGTVQEGTDRLDAQGNVVVKSDSGMVLLADELYYVQKAERVMSDGFVTVITQNDSLSGFGFSSAPDLKDWVILNTSGTTWREVEPRQQQE
jgi:LPS export ABC transporter protein LptC